VDYHFKKSSMTPHLSLRLLREFSLLIMRHKHLMKNLIMVENVILYGEQHTVLYEYIHTSQAHCIVGYNIKKCTLVVYCLFWQRKGACFYTSMPFAIFIFLVFTT